ncbi:coiled-coil domain-containing protein 112 [Pelobates fuscus]|uniref:coiled-coil domain-containing protein 112 n=1 Tax=Pelobates fuscus TaxID=191477 RepID=UPI002FE49FC4
MPLDVPAGYSSKMASLATVSPVSETKEAGGEQDESWFSESEREIHVNNWKTKADQAKKAEFFRETEKLKNQIANFEKDKNDHLYNKKNEFRIEYSALEEYEQKQANVRKAEKTKTRQQLTKIGNNVKRLQRQLKDVKPTPEFVEKLRVMVEEVDSAIIAFKEEQRIIYEELLKDEKSTIAELSALERKIEASQNTAPEVFKAPSGKVVSCSKISSQLPEEVEIFEIFLQQSGGRGGGWDDFDHQSFLKIWTKHKGKPTYLKEAMEYLPSRTREDVQQHETWYKEFLLLEGKKREAIQKWKAKKHLEKAEMSKLHVKQELSEFDRHQQEEALRQKQEMERRKRQQELEAWKRKKEIEEITKHEMKIKEEEEQQRKQRKEYQRQLEVKLLVEQHARKKKEQEAFLRLEKEMREEAEREEKRRMACFQIQRFQDMDQRKLEERAQKNKAREELEAEKERRLAKLKEKVQVHVDRDPARLCKLTKGWEARCRESGPTGATGPSLHIPHRAVPTWRQDL